ncbi:hypothetical protein BCN_P166 (plasmid) [Bacillus cereus NC7401]|nr:hypothetical protein BCN_P166 [Bacillus cereus NC7401]
MFLLIIHISLRSTFCHKVKNKFEIHEKVCVWIIYPYLFDICE